MVMSNQERAALLRRHHTEFTTPSADGDLLAEPSSPMLEAMTLECTPCKKKGDLPGDSHLFPQTDAISHNASVKEIARGQRSDYNGKEVKRVA